MIGQIFDTVIVAATDRQGLLYMYSGCLAA